jgi:hypothetical protein
LTQQLSDKNSNLLTRSNPHAYRHLTIHGLREWLSRSNLRPQLHIRKTLFYAIFEGGGEKEFCGFGDLPIEIVETIRRPADRPHSANSP